MSDNIPITDLRMELSLPATTRVTLASTNLSLGIGFEVEANPQYIDAPVTAVQLAANVRPG